MARSKSVTERDVIPFLESRDLKYGRLRGSVVIPFDDGTIIQIESLGRPRRLVLGCGAVVNARPSPRIIRSCSGR